MWCKYLYIEYNIHVKFIICCIIIFYKIEILKDVIFLLLSSQYFDNQRYIERRQLNRDYYHM